MEVRKPATVARRNTLWYMFPAAGATSNGDVGPKNDFRRPDEKEGLNGNSTSARPSSIIATDGRSSIFSEAVSGESLQRAYGGEWDQRPKKHPTRLEKLQLEIEALGMKIAEVEKAINDVQVAAQYGSYYGGKQGDVLRAEEVRLVRKEEQLRAEKQQLQEEKLFLLAGRRARSVTWASAEDIKDPASEAGEVSGSMGSADAERFRSVGMDEITGCLVTTIKAEEDARLLTRLESFSNPILVSTLVAGFCLALFDISELRIARQFALFSFALEISATLVLCGIAFHAQQLYSYSSQEVPRTRTFLQEMRPFTAFALAFSVVGIISFMVAFILEASEILGHPWLVLVSVVVFPSIFAGTTFVSTIRVMKRLSTLSRRRANLSE